MESYYNGEYNLQNADEDQETLPVITLEPEKEGKGQSENDDSH